MLIRHLCMMFEGFLPILIMLTNLITTIIWLDLIKHNLLLTGLHLKNKWTYNYLCKRKNNLLNLINHQ